MTHPEQEIEAVGVAELKELLDALYEHANKVDPGFKNVKPFSEQKRMREREVARFKHGQAYGLRKAVIEIRKWLGEDE